MDVPERGSPDTTIIVFGIFGLFFGLLIVFTVEVVSA